MNVPVRFAFTDFRTELQKIQEIASSFLERDAKSVFSDAAQRLDLIQTQGVGGSHRFSVDQDRPVQTLLDNRFEGQGRKGAFSVFGQVCWTWEITPVTPERRAKVQYFDVTGVASTQIRIVRSVDDRQEEIAMWRFELGDLVSPGTYFHAQVLGKSDSPPFPHSLPVPRLPSIFVTPMAAVEFMLGELFQDKWEQHATGDSDALKFWNQIQKRRLEQVLNWKLKQVSDNQSSPWVALKRAKPTSDDTLCFS